MPYSVGGVIGPEGYSWRQEGKYDEYKRKKHIQFFAEVTSVKYFSALTKSTTIQNSMEKMMKR